MLALWLPVASASDRPSPDRLVTARASKAHVRWSGFHGVQFGESLSAAARKLHGRVASDGPPDYARGVDYPRALVGISGSLQDQVRSGGNVGSFQASTGRVIFPRHTFIGESLARFRRALGKGAHPERPEHNAAVGYYLVGPRGRTLWAWGGRGTGVQAIGLAESLAGAEFDWGYEG